MNQQKLPLGVVIAVVLIRIGALQSLAQIKTRGLEPKIYFIHNCTASSRSFAAATVCARTSAWRLAQPWFMLRAILNTCAEPPGGSEHFPRQPSVLGTQSGP